MFIRLSSFIEKCCILSPKQFGFRKNHSTYMALLSIVDDISDSLDRGDYSVEIFIDLSKAFDTVNHHILLR